MITALDWFLSFVPVNIDSSKTITFIDGDQASRDLLSCYEQHIEPLNSEVHYVTVGTIPNVLKPFVYSDNVVLTQLEGFIKGKETTDKYIAAHIVKSLNQGYTKINVVSNDYDFLDIFKMVSMIEDCPDKIDFTLYMPKRMESKKGDNISVKNIRIIG